MKKLMLLTILTLTTATAAVSSAEGAVNTPTATPTNTPVPVQYELNSAAAIPTIIADGKTTVYFEAKEFEMQPILSNKRIYPNLTWHNCSGDYLFVYVEGKIPVEDTMELIFKYSKGIIYYGSKLPKEVWKKYAKCGKRDSGSGKSNTKNGIRNTKFEIQNTGNGK